MKFSEIVQQAVQLLQTRGRVTYRVLRREFDLDDGSLEDLQEQLIEAEALAVDQDGKMLVWVGAAPVPSAEHRVPRPESLFIPNPFPLIPRFWFTEGFDTKDLQEAKELLEELT